MRNICVFCSSSNSIAPIFRETALELGVLIAKKGWTLVYGGANVGTMGALANAVKGNGGKVIGIINEGLNNKGITFYQADKIIVTKDIRTRKQTMQEYSDAFIALPGGFGTLDELTEILTLKQLEMFDAPLVLIDIKGFYKHFIKFMDSMFAEKFVRSEYKNLYAIAPNAESSIRYIENYKPKRLWCTNS